MHQQSAEKPHPVQERGGVDFFVPLSECGQRKSVMLANTMSYGKIDLRP